MEHEILDLIDRYWKFDDNQTPVSNWHDKQDLLEVVRKALHIHDVVGRSEQLVCDCGNKLTNKELYFGQCLQCDKNIEEVN